VAKLLMPSGADHEQELVLAIVGRLLNEEPVSPEELAALRYTIDEVWHIAVIAEGSEARCALRAFSVALGSQLLIVDAGGLTWAWFGTCRRTSARTIDIGVPRGDLTRLVVGAARRGRPGFRSTHFEALAALAVARGEGKTLIHCADVTLEAALVASPLLLELHQETYLAPLDILPIGGRTARETLRAYLSCEQNKASASAKLGVSRRTVENRLGRIADALERPLHVCLPELEVALRLEELASGAELPAARTSRKAAGLQAKSC
jgi:PucR C-terminal helix-turn-helix domain